MTKTAILFDLDGTLWDACDVIAAAWNGCMARMGQPLRFTSADCRGFCGKTLEQIAAEVFPRLDIPSRLALMRQCCASENLPLAERGGTLYPGLFPILERLRQTHLLAVVSNCQEGYIEAFFQGNGTGRLFEDYESAGRTGRSKAENIRLVMERNCISKAIYVGDTEGDSTAAATAGVPFIHAAYGFGKVPGSLYRIHRLAELPPLAAQLLG